MKHLKTHKFLFKNAIVLAIECKMYLKIQQKLHCLGCISKQTMCSVVKKTRLNSGRYKSRTGLIRTGGPSWSGPTFVPACWIPRRTISWWKASLPPQKESWAFFWTFSLRFLSFNGVFLTLKCRTLVLKHLHGDRAAPSLLKMAICHKGFQIW